MADEIEELAIEYFKNMSSSAKKRLMKRIVSSLDDMEKVELAKIILKK